ncbi:hypothetical protein NL676_000301 [Syzygium grande]|nr:hypothetical protein NL676_000301 [Syzygium grande]
MILQLNESSPFLVSRGCGGPNDLNEMKIVWRNPNEPTYSFPKDSRQLFFGSRILAKNRRRWLGIAPTGVAIFLLLFQEAGSGLCTSGRILAINRRRWLGIAPTGVAIFLLLFQEAGSGLYASSYSGESICKINILTRRTIEVGRIPNKSRVAEAPSSSI